MLRKIKLHGFLADKFGTEFMLDVSTVSECIRALSLQIKGFEEAIKGGQYRVIRVSKQSEIDLDESQLGFNLGNASELHIKPVIGGAKGGGGGKSVVGMGLIALAPLTGGASMALFGAGMAIIGSSSFLSPTPQVDSYSRREAPEERPSFLFDGPVNLSEQGAAVPLVYGQIRTGSVVISAGIAAEEV
ncbi:hypothetical protein [Zooshikella sp. RANM57]|uniref:hypothetical protein n=1 Tax=Zooshikella sp. RANM57 TaxID=3425863 RepID=UPI003D6F9EF2